MKENGPLIILTAQRVWMYRKFPPYGIMYVARGLREAGFRVRIIHPETGRAGAVAEAVKKERPLFVGFSVMQGPLLLEDVEISRALQKEGIPVVWGGIFPSMLPELVLSADYVDYIVTGEAELTSVQFAHALASGKKPENVAGVGYREDGGVRLNPPDPFHKDIDSFRPDWDLIRMKTYLEVYPKSQSVLLRVPLSRGCPFPCSFCYNQVQKDRKLFRIHGHEWVRRELDFLKDKWGVNMVHWVGDNPFSKPEVGKEIIGAAKTPWISATRINLVDEEFTSWMKETQCQYLGFGIESGSDRVLEILKKGFTVDTIIKGIGHLDKAGVFGVLSWMHLIPGETNEDRKMTRKLMDELYRMTPRIYHSGVHGLRPWPGTIFWDEAVKMGLEPPRTLEDWAHYQYVSPPLFGWTKERLYRLTVMNRVLYGRARTAPRLVPDWQYEIFRRRFLRGKFPGALEEKLAASPRLKKHLEDL